MKDTPIQLDNLFGADEYWRAGQCPWTFFAFPTSLAGTDGLPPDEDAQSLLGKLQRRGIRVGLWANAIADNTTYYACPKEDIQRLNDAIDGLETNGTIQREFLNKRSEHLFSLVSRGT